jgi:ribosomal protein L35
MKVTARGKVMRKQAGKSHLMSGKSPGRKRSLRKSLPLHHTVLKKTINLMG